MNDAAKQKPVVVVGAGLSGLRCAGLLQEAGVETIVLDRDNAPGGRVQTEEVDGFRLDRGFQVLLTAYPESGEALDYKSLDLRTFESGAHIRISNRLYRLSDPVRRPTRTLETLRAPIGSVKDKLGILRLRRFLIGASLDELFARDEMTIMDSLSHEWGFSSRMVETFFRPFLGGIMLDRSLRGSSRMFEFVFKMFSEGHAALPAGGMGQISAQLAARLKPGTLQLEQTVSEIERGRVVLGDGSAIEASDVVAAVDGPEADRLLDVDSSPRYRETRCHYFAARHAPIREPLLILNGQGDGPVNNLAVLTNVCPEYSATGEALISVTVLDDYPERSDEPDAVVKQLTEWFGPIVAHWRHLRTFNIKNALPDQAIPFLSRPAQSVRVAPGIYRCGDYLDTASINGALRSGRLAAYAILSDRASA